MSEVTEIPAGLFDSVGAGSGLDAVLSAAGASRDTLPVQIQINGNHVIIVP
jgi:hypothetical protein